MCMLFILWKAHGGYERGLRGVERLLRTLLCTLSDIVGVLHKKTRHASRLRMRAAEFPDRAYSNTFTR